MIRIQMDHIPFWNWGPSGAGTGFGQGTTNIIEYYATMSSNFDQSYAHFDPDFLETLFPVTMPYIESRTEYSFWALWSAPLIVATDIRNMSAKMASIITNPEVISIDQDELVCCLQLPFLTAYDDDCVGVTVFCGVSCFFFFAFILFVSIGVFVPFYCLLLLFHPLCLPKKI
jgi:hypothetical protein